MKPPSHTESESKLRAEITSEATDAVKSDLAHSQGRRLL